MQLLIKKTKTEFVMNSTQAYWNKNKFFFLQIIRWWDVQTYREVRDQISITFYFVNIIWNICVSWHEHLSIAWNYWNHWKKWGRILKTEGTHQAIVKGKVKTSLPQQVCIFVFHVKCKNKHEDASQKPHVVHTATLHNLQFLKLYW